MIKKIIISGDLLRTRVENGITYNFHEKRINKYYDFFKYQIHEATKLPVEKLNTDNTSFKPSVMYAFCNLEYKSDIEWLQIYDYKNISEDCLDYYYKFIKDSLVIYIEMPIIFKRIHNILNVPYIDLTVHPIRFLDDHLFGFSTNERLIFDRMKKYQVDEHMFYMQANMIKSIVDYNPLPIIENSALIAGQTNIDKALYSEGKCLSIMDFANEIEKMGRIYDCVYYKAHPFNTDLKRIHDFLKQYDFVKLCPSDWNTYKILSNSNLKKVYAITSGVLYEAKYFEKEAESLYKPYLHFDYSHECEFSEETYLSIYNEYINPFFWKNILQDIISINEDCQNCDMDFRPNRIRATFNDYWAYTELDPTVITITKQFGSSIREIKKEIKKLDIDEERVNQISSQLLEMNSKVAELENNIHILRMDPCFEKNILKRQIKRIAFWASSNSIYWNHVVILKKLKREASQFIDSSEKITAIKGITYRPHAPHGGRGGGGAVLSAMQSILGNKIGNFDITYNYSEADGIWHTMKNRYFTYKDYQRFINKDSHLLPLYAAIAFTIQKTKNESGKLYICHEYATAYALSLLKKKYIVVLHTQGTRVDEKITLGEPLMKDEMRTISQCEKQAVESAIYVCFPSKGAEKMYFESKFCNVDRNKISVGPYLYNTVYADVKYKPNFVEKDNSYLTFISVGTLTEAKGQDRVCDWFIDFLDKYHGKVRWICVGKGPMEKIIIEKINDIKNKYNNFEMIRLKNVPFPTVQYLYSISDIYIMRHRVAVFDLATLEAMKNSCALVLSEVGGNIEYNINDNVVFDYQISELLDLSNIRKLQIKNCEVYDNNFSKEKFGKRYSELILECCNKLNSKN